MIPAYYTAIKQATFLAAHDAIRDPRTSGLAEVYLAPAGITSILDAPIRSHGGLAGVLCLEHVGPARHWNGAEQCVAAACAGFVARVWDARERLRLEREVEVAQRLEFAGRIAASVARDFSNIATMIGGFADDLLSQCEEDDPRRDALQAIHDAGVSARGLVRQLLHGERANQLSRRTSLDFSNGLHQRNDAHACCNREQPGVLDIAFRYSRCRCGCAIIRPPFPSSPRSTERRRLDSYLVGG